MAKVIEGHTDKIDRIDDNRRIDELYKVDSPYRTALQKSYEEFKKSKEYQDHRLTETEYVQAMHQTRAFEYVSIDDEQSKIEMWRDIALGVGLVVLTIFCPPAGAVAGVALASADMYSAATGKDWGTGRELDATERTLRGTFALFDLIPAGKYLGTLAKTGKTAGLTAVKNSLKTTLKEGLEQGTKNLDSFKGVLKNAKGLGDNVYHSLSTYRKQITHQLKNSVDEKVLNLSKATQEGLERAKQFTLEVPTVRVIQKASTGRQMMQFETTSKSLGDTGLGKSLDNLASKAKNVENASLSRLRARNAFYGNKVDDVAKGAKEAAEQAGKKARQEFSEETVENVSRDISESQSLFVGKLRGEDITLYDIEMKKINYVKRDRSVLRELRNDFNKFVRKDFLKSISSDIKNLKSHGLSETDIQKLKDGLVPKGYQVHHELPLDDSGTNDFSNLVLIKNEPYYKVVTNYQNSIARTMKIGESKEVLWPIIGKNIYN